MLTEISGRLKLTIFWASLDIIWSIGQFRALFFTYRKVGEDFVCQQCDLWSSKVFDKGGGEDNECTQNVSHICICAELF